MMPCRMGISVCVCVCACVCVCVCERERERERESVRERKRETPRMPVIESNIEGEHLKMGSVDDC